MSRLKTKDVKEHNKTLNKIKKKYLENGFNKEHAETLSLFAMYIPGFKNPIKIK